MASGDFERSLPLVLAHEGGLSDNKYDPGGRTYQGIEQTEYNVYRKSKGLPLRDVVKMTPDERDEIYHNSYWDPVLAEELPAGLDYAVFDGGVNSGPPQSVKWLQRALGTVTVDGYIGPKTLAAVEQYQDLQDLIRRVCEARRQFLKQLSILPHFPGLLTRVDDVEKTALAWASEGTPPPPVPLSAPQAKATRRSAVAAPSTATGNATTAAGGGALAATAVASGHVVGVAPEHPVKKAVEALQHVKHAISEKAAPHPWITITHDQLLLVLCVLAAVVVLGLVLAWAARRARARRADALGDTPDPKTPLQLPDAADGQTPPADATLPLVKSLYSRVLSVAWIALTVVVNVIALAKLLQGAGLAHENWHQPFLWLGTLYDTYAGQAFGAMSGFVSQQFGFTLPSWLMPVFVLYVSTASAFMVAGTGLVRRDTTAQSLWGAVIHAGWILAIPNFVVNAVRYHVIARFARQNTFLFFAYIAIFVGCYVGARYVNDDILPAFAQNGAPADKAT